MMEIICIMNSSTMQHFYFLKCSVPEEADGDLLMKLIINGPRQFSFKFEEIREILLQGARVFLEEPTLLEVSDYMIFRQQFLIV